MIPIYDLSWLRALLFIDQRATLHTIDGPIDARHERYVQALLDAIRAVIRDRPVPIPTGRLVASDLPEPDEDERPIWRFACTFDAYRYFGSDGVNGRLSSFANSVRAAFNITGALPRLGEIGMLRACLAYEERRRRAWDDDDPQIPAADYPYATALVHAIQERLT